MSELLTSVDEAAEGDGVRAVEALTMSVDEAAKLLGVSRGLAYEAARRGELPTIRLGRRLLVPRQRLLELVGAQGMREPDLSRAQDSRDENVNGNAT